MVWDSLLLNVVKFFRLQLCVRVVQDVNHFFTDVPEFYLGDTLFKVRAILHVLSASSCNRKPILYAVYCY